MESPKTEIEQKWKTDETNETDEIDETVVIFIHRGCPVNDRAWQFRHHFIESARTVAPAGPKG